MAHKQGSGHSQAVGEGAHAASLPVDHGGLHHLAFRREVIDQAFAHGYAGGQFHGLACEGR